MRKRPVLKIRGIGAAALAAAGIIFAGRAGLWAAAFDLEGIGARGRAMAGAFVATADDFSAIYWNPASLASLPKRELGFTYEDRFNLGLVGVSHVALAYPEIGPGGIGISWTRLATTDKISEFKYSENTYTFAYGATIWNGIALGTSLNFYRLLSDINASGLGLNLALKCPIGQKFTIGGLWQNTAATKLRYEGGAEDSLPRDVHLGVAFAPVKTFRTEVDVDNLIPSKPKAHLGVEMKSPGDTLALRGGASQSVASGFNWIYSVGATLNVKSMALDYSFENHFDLGATHLFGVKVAF